MYNIKTPEDAKAMIDEVRSKGEEATQRQLSKLGATEAITLAGLIFTTIKGLHHTYLETGEIECLKKVKTGISHLQTMFSFIEVGIENVIQDKSKSDEIKNDNSVTNNEHTDRNRPSA